MSEERVDLGSLLRSGKALEAEYKWQEAASMYEEASRQIDREDHFRNGRLRESRAFALFRYSFQSDTQNDFAERLSAARDEYARAKEAYARSEPKASSPWLLRCDAMIATIDLWRSSESSQKARFAEAAWRLAKDSMSAFEARGEGPELARTLNAFAFVFTLTYLYSSDFGERERIIHDALSFSLKGAKYVEASGEANEIARSYFNVGVFNRVIGDIFSEGDLRRTHMAESEGWMKKALDSSRESSVIEWTLSSIGVALPMYTSDEDLGKICDDALRIAGRMNDRLVSGAIHDYMGFRTFVKAHAAEDAEKRDSLIDKALEYVKAAQKDYGVLSYTVPQMGPMWPHAPDCGYYMWKAYFESDMDKKRRYAQEGLRTHPDELRIAEESGFPSALYGAYWDSIKLHTQLAMTEKDAAEKRILLGKSMDSIGKLFEIADRLLPKDFFRDGIMGFLADAEYQLSEIAAEREERVSGIRSAIKHKKADSEAFLASSESYISLRPLLDPWIGASLQACGRWSTTLYELTGKREDMSAAIEAFSQSASHFRKAGWPSRCAENHWQAAMAHGTLGEHKEASAAFAEASKCYEEGSKSIPHLAGLFDDYALYMKAWSEIEQAHDHHLKREARSSRDHFEKAEELLRRSKKWAYLASDFGAWAKLENAEDLSREDLSKEAAGGFVEAANMFRTGSAIMTRSLSEIRELDELKMVTDLVKVAEMRESYCAARVMLEDARILHKRGDESASSEKYGAAADAFQKLLSGLENEQDRKELQLIIQLSKAWQAMAKAEADDSAEAYAEASSLFESARDLSSGEKARALALGHSKFAKALEIGTRFSETMDIGLHASATEQLESAAVCYLKADLGSASQYAKACKHLFDGYVYMNRASKEEDHDKKVKLYSMTEKVLQASASSFGKAEQPKKREQVLKLLEKVSEDRELAVSLTELFHAPLVLSSTTSFPSPTPTYEQPVGLERFEHADIQANLIAQNRELKMDEDLYLEIELVNAGRGPAQLIKLQDPVPKGFTLMEESGGYRMEDSYLNLKGKRLDPLKTEEIRLVLKPTRRGHFALKPRILYLDDSGKYKSHEPEPVKVTVGVEATVPPGKAFLTDTREAAEARALLASLNVVTLSHFRIVGNYVRYGDAVCNDLKDARQKITAACREPSPKRENYIIWAPPGSGKTYFVQEVAALLGDSVHYCEVNVAKLDEAGVRSALAGLRTAGKPCLCLVDEVDAKPDEPWLYESLLPFLDASATEGARFIFVLAGSSGSSLDEMKKAIASRPKGPDVLSRVPTGNEYTIPPMGVGDRLLVVLSQFRQAGRQMGHEVREVEKLGLYYVAVNPRLSNARQLREFAVRCAERVLPGDDRLKYDSLFHPGDRENKLFWTHALQSAGSLVDSFLLVED